MNVLDWTNFWFKKKYAFPLGAFLCCFESYVECTFTLSVHDFAVSKGTVHPKMNLYITFHQC